MDVLVVGGGPAGIGAALGAARRGANTLLIENHAFFGGVAASRLGMPINQMRPGRKARSKVYEAIISKLLALCTKKRCPPRELNVSQLQDALRADDVDLDPAERDQDKLRNKG